jgi:hypothetical protein
MSRQRKAVLGRTGPRRLGAPCLGGVEQIHFAQTIGAAYALPRPVPAFPDVCVHFFVQVIHFSASLLDPSLADLSERDRYNLYYIENWSLWFDLRIIALTIIHVFRSRHAG